MKYRQKWIVEVFFLNRETVDGEFPSWVPERYRRIGSISEGVRYVLVREKNNSIGCLLEGEFLANYEPVDG